MKYQIHFASTLRGYSLQWNKQNNCRGSEFHDFRECTEGDESLQVKKTAKVPDLIPREK